MDPKKALVSVKKGAETIISRKEEGKNTKIRMWLSRKPQWKKRTGFDGNRRLF